MGRLMRRPQYARDAHGGLRVRAPDGRFWALIEAGDRHRDARQWIEAEAAYRAALDRHGDIAIYWVQHGHTVKEQQRYDEAEISYRTACALGVAPHKVEEHLRFVMRHQGVSESAAPIRYHQRAASPDLVPGRMDVVCLARLLWHTDHPSALDVVRLLRQSATRDALFAAMVRDPKFAAAALDWFDVLQEGDL